MVPSQFQMAGPFVLLAHVLYYIREFHCEVQLCHNCLHAFACSLDSVDTLQIYRSCVLQVLSEGFLASSFFLVAVIFSGALLDLLFPFWHLVLVLKISGHFTKARCWSKCHPEDQTMTPGPSCWPLLVWVLTTKSCYWDPGTTDSVWLGFSYHPENMGLKIFLAPKNSGGQG